jgi:hypothetical protein
MIESAPQPITRPPVALGKQPGDEKSHAPLLRPHRNPFTFYYSRVSRGRTSIITDRRAPAAVMTTAAHPVAKMVFEAVAAAPLTAPRSLVAVRTITGMGNGAKDAEPDDTGGNAGREAPAIPVMSMMPVMPMMPMMPVVAVARIGGLSGDCSDADRERQPQQRMVQFLEHSFFSALRHRATGRAVRLV